MSLSIIGSLFAGCLDQLGIHESGDEVGNWFLDRRMNQTGRLCVRVVFSWVVMIVVGARVHVDARIRWDGMGCDVICLVSLCFVVGYGVGGI